MKKIPIIAAIVGFLNGLLGGGAGAILVPYLVKKCKFSQNKALATALAVLLPLSSISVALYWWRGNIDLTLAFPYVLGGAIGGIFGAKIFTKMKENWLKRGFSLLLLFSGVRSFL